MAKNTPKKKTKEVTKTASAAKAKSKKAETQAKPKAAAAVSKPKAPKAKKPVNSDLTPVIKIKHDDVAAKAYEIWLAKGRPIGQDEQNWLEAVDALAKK